jgi:hypothetical protein
MKIDLTNREIELLMGALGTNIETIKRRHNPADPMIAELISELFDLETDFREALHRQDDEWSNPEDPDLHMDPVDFAAKHDTEADQIVICDAEINAGINREGEVFVVAEDDFIQRGMSAREQAKANSRAAERRALNFSGATRRPPDDEKSEMQSVDMWKKPTNDPADW